MARILVIDDNPRFRAMVREVLEGVGHEVAAAADGPSGIDAVRSSPADLAIVGTPTIDELHQEFPDLKIIAVAATEPFAVGSELPSAWACSAQRSLNKPIRHREMLATVGELLANN